MTKILIIEDNYKLAKTIAEFLGSKYTLDFAIDGLIGLHKAHNAELDLIILDVNLPRLGGFEIAKELRQDGINTPILMLTAHSETTDIVTGFKQGVDAYICKPFNYQEFKSRLDALLQRPPRARLQALSHGELILNLKEQQLYYRDQPILLRKKELAIMKLLLAYPDKVFSRTEILNNLWESGTEPSLAAVDVHISNIRSKIQTASGCNLIQTIHGVGFRLLPT